MKKFKPGDTVWVRATYCDKDVQDGTHKVLDMFWNDEDIRADVPENSETDIKRALLRAQEGERQANALIKEHAEARKHTLAYCQTLENELQKRVRMDSTRAAEPPAPREFWMRLKKDTAGHYESVARGDVPGAFLVREVKR